MCGYIGYRVAMGLECPCSDIVGRKERVMTIYDGVVGMSITELAKFIAEGKCTYCLLYPDRCVKNSSSFDTTGCTAGITAYLSQDKKLSAAK